MSSTAGPHAVPGMWTEAVAALTPTPSSSWTKPFLELLPVSGMSVSTLGDVLESETLFASDALAARVDEVQFDLSEGPCWDAVATHRPVFETDLGGRGPGRWPVLAGALAGDGVQGLFVFPLILGNLALGAIDLYAAQSCTLDSADIARMQGLAGNIARLVLQQTVLEAGAEMESEQTNPHSRRTVHQATGAVMSQLDLSSADAYLLIQGRAFTEGRSMSDVAADILDRRIRFTHKQDGIEETP